MSRANVSTLLLAAWLGAAVLFSAVVAPAAFAVLPSRSLAGDVVGRVLPVVFIAGMTGAALAALLLGRAAARFGRVRRAAMVAAAAACAIAQFAVAPRIDRVRRSIDGPIEQLATTDPRRVAFGRLHAISVAWLGVAMLAVAGAIVLGVRARDPDVPPA